MKEALFYIGRSGNGFRYMLPVVRSINRKSTQGA